MSFTERTAALLGEDAILTLSKTHVLVVGIGGVGSFAAEALVRAGIGAITLVDNDTVAESNLNRQLIALRSTVGLPKVEAAKARFADINPDLAIRALYMCCDGDTVDEILAPAPDYILDCIDSLTCKAELICRAHAQNIPILSALGTGNKTDPTALCRTTLDKTEGCPLARALRHALRGSGCEKTDVIFSRELPHRAYTPEKGQRLPPASCAWVPSSAGLLMAGECVKDLLKDIKGNRTDER